MKFSTDYYSLSNGVRVLTIPMPGVESVTALVLVRTGSRNETEEQLGISHVLEHMLFKGTKQYPSPMAIAEAVDELGALNNAFTDKECTGYYITSAARHLPKTLKIIASMIREPLLPPEDLRREREVIVEEINMYEDHPMERAGEEFENLIYGGSKLGRLIIGTKETVRGVEAGDLRRYMGKWYRGGNILVVLAGQLETNEQNNGRMQELFGKLGNGKMGEFVERGGYGVEHKLHIKRPTEQAHFVMGVPGLDMNDPRRYALQVAQVVLGGNMSSRLFNEIREKRGLAYYVSAMVDARYDAGYLAVRVGVKLAKLGEAKKVVREEMLKLGETLTAKELSRAKEYLLGKLPLSLEGTMEVAQMLGMRALITGEVRQPAEVMDKVKAVTMGQVRQVLREIVKDSEIRTAVVGPRFD